LIKGTEAQIKGRALLCRYRLRVKVAREWPRLIVITAPSRECPISNDSGYFSRGKGWVAQLAEQRTENPRVGGSIPPPATPRENSES
jgi:hypothetical protein